MRAFSHEEGAAYNWEALHDWRGAFEFNKQIKFLTLPLAGNLIHRELGLVSPSSVQSLAITNVCFDFLVDGVDPTVGVEPQPQSFPLLTELALGAMDGRLALYISSCDMPLLDTLTLHLSHASDTQEPPGPAAMEILTPLLTAFGKRLEVLALSASPSKECTVDMKAVLTACPALTSLSFNADWELADADGTHPASHARLAHVGLHAAAAFIAITPLPPVPGEPPAFSRFLSAAHEEAARGRAAANIAWLSKRNFSRLEGVVCWISRFARSSLEEEGGHALTRASRWGSWTWRDARRKRDSDSKTMLDVYSINEQRVGTDNPRYLKVHSNCGIYSAL